MNILLIAATAKEISPFLELYRRSDSTQNIDVLITGIGLTSATYSLAKQISIKKPLLVIQAGIAGCFDKNIPLGSVVIIKQDAIADLSVMENNQLLTMFDLGLIKPGQPPYSKGRLINPYKELMKEIKLKKVKAVTINHITTSKQMIGQYGKKFGPAIESMEGAALHYVCLMEKIPFLQIRSISNYVGQRDKKKWNIKEAVINLNKEIAGIITTLNFKP
ncbi:MAG: futalosine hydrolase [Chitinophagaceae bacterium]|nr:futalosine hydrolase [Chitinophagaceae bacterium]